MTLNERINAFVALGEFLQQFYHKSQTPQKSTLNGRYFNDFNELIETVNHHNAWFTPSNVRQALKGIECQLNKEKLTKWIAAYPALQNSTTNKRIGVVMAGNIPMVGFNDMLSILISGNTMVGKLSSNDQLLLPFIGKILCAIAPAFESQIDFTKDQLKNIDAVIATGSDNSARFFDYYFNKYPSIIRKNRNSVAVLTGNEKTEELAKLGDDVFYYFGMGCRNVSKVFVPRGYKFDPFYEAIFHFKDVLTNNKYSNNYEYNRTIFLMGDASKMLDNNFLILKEDESYSSPIGVLFYEYYDDIEVLNTQLQNDHEKLQCIVANTNAITNAQALGKSQHPELTDYADGIDTIDFLLNL